MLKNFQRVLGYVLGTLSWTAGFHCLEGGEGDHLRLGAGAWSRHLIKLFTWITALGLLARAWPAYRDWLLGAAWLSITLAFLVKGLIFLYLRVFAPSKLVDLVPGTRHFLCPQCLQKQVFRFTPVSFRFGFFVTYLCRYCFCLVDGRGRQIFFPSTVSFRRASIFLPRLMPASFVAILAGGWASAWIWACLNRP
ncbi:MAG TPA: hypothetical protein VMU88_02015 [bacterium]|nr:hypothetical protein [bacterium]